MEIKIQTSFPPLLPFSVSLPKKSKIPFQRREKTKNRNSRFWKDDRVNRKWDEALQENGAAPKYPRDKLPNAEQIKTVGE